MVVGALQADIDYRADKRDGRPTVSTDATGVLVQPAKGGDQSRRGCRHAHFLVQIDDADHVFFEYLARETSAAIGELFRGFGGYVQADAKSTFDFLFTPPDERPPPEDEEAPDLAERHEVGCWALPSQVLGMRRHDQRSDRARGRAPDQARLRSGSVVARPVSRRDQGAPRAAPAPPHRRVPCMGRRRVRSRPSCVPRSATRIANAAH